MPRRRATFALLTLSCLILSAGPIIRELTRRTDIWWTPQALLVPLGESKDRVEIYVGGKLVEDRIAAGQLQIVEGAGVTPVAAGDVGLRFNNSDRVRASRVPLMLACAAWCGAIACLAILMASGRLVERPERPRPGEVP